MKVVVMGAGGHGRVVLDIAQHQPEIEVIGFIDDNEKLLNTKVNEIPVIGSFSTLHRLMERGVKGIIIGIGDNKTRAKFFRKSKKLGMKLINAIHPRTTIAKTVSIGEGIVVMAGVVVNPNTKIDNGVVINTGATVDHDCVLEDFSHIWPGANLAGNVKVGMHSYVGIGSVVVQNIVIGRNSVVGAGAVVISDVPDNVTVAGVPARVIKER